jgi:hypothetical protein
MTRKIQRFQEKKVGLGTKCWGSAPLKVSGPAGIVPANGKSINWNSGKRTEQNQAKNILNNIVVHEDER